MKCIILAAGYATRLKPLTDNMPKHLLPVAGKPMLEYVLDQLGNFVEDITIITNSKFYPAFREWAEKITSHKITVLDDGTTSNETRLGGLGDLNFAIKQRRIDEDVMVVLGDNLAEFKMKDFVDFYKEKKTAVVAACDVKDFGIAKKMGVVAIDENNKMISFVEKPETPQSTLVSTGFYIYPKEIIGRLQEYLESGGNKDGPGFFVQWLYPQEPVYVFVFEERWWDIGGHEQYEEVNRLYAEKNK